MNWVQDLTYALRTTRNNPWFSAAIVLTLALGIGINTTVFTLVNAVLIKPLPFPGGERIVTFMNSNLGQNRESLPVSYPDFLEYKGAVKSFDAFEGWLGEPASISDKGGPPLRYTAARVTSGLFDMVAVKPLIGRSFTPADTKAGAPETILLSHGVWKDRYGADPTIAGRTLRLNNKPATIIGVMPEGFKFPVREEVWMPLIPDAELEKRSRRNMIIGARMRPGVSMAEARAELDVITSRLEKGFPETNKGLGVNLRTFNQTFNGGNIRTVFLLMLGAVGFVLLIACANVANMLLSRAVSRLREVSIRTALGASRWRLIRQLLTESVLLSLAGGLLGFGLATLGVRAVANAVANVPKPSWIDFSMDHRVFFYLTAVSIVAGIVFGLAPALQSSRADLNSTLKDGTRTAGQLRAGWLSGSLVVLQFLLAVVLLTGAGLMMRSFLNHQDLYSRYQAGRIFVTRLVLNDTRYPKPEDRFRFFEQLLPRLAALSGVNTAALASNLPMEGAGGVRYEVEGRPDSDPDHRPSTNRIIAMGDYFRVIGVPMLHGRAFEETDGLPGKEAVIVTQPFAERYWPRQSALGKRIRFYRDKEPLAWMSIVGVIPDIETDPMRSTRSNPDPLAFVPYRQDSAQWMRVVLRTSVPPESMIAAVRAEVMWLDEDLALGGPFSLAAAFEQSGWAFRVFGSLFGVFAIVALCMAAMGIYAVMSHATNRRTQEIGVRLALGAGSADILRLVMKRGLLQLSAGLLLGGAAAFAVTRLMSGILYKVSPTDLLTFTSVATVLTSAGLAACWLPARRAAKLDPVRALRYE